MMKRREYNYIIYRIPKALIADAVKTIGGIKGIDDLVFSTDSERPSHFVVVTEDRSLERFSRGNQNAVTVRIPITETNNHKKLSQQYIIVANLYFGGTVKGLEEVFGDN